MAKAGPHPTRSSHLCPTVMRRAWAMSREARTLYGGPVRSFMAEALRLAWAEAKADPLLTEIGKMIASARARRTAIQNTDQELRARFPGMYAAASRGRLGGRGSDVYGIGTMGR